MKGERSAASEAWRDAAAASPRNRRPPEPTAPPAQPEETWVLVEELRDEATHAVQRSRSTPSRRDSERDRKRAAAREDDERALRQQLGTAVGPKRAGGVERKLRDAARDFDAERFGNAARILRPLSEQAPRVAAVRELYGLTLYRQGKWRLAAKELEVFRALTDSTEQHPVLADCYRALGQRARVDELWDELRQASPSGALVTEGRIVTAGSLADRGDLPAAIALLEQGWRYPKRPKPHHLRRAYALADLYERAGEIGRARELFGRVRAADPTFADVSARVRALG